MFHTARARTAANAALVALAVIVGAACGDDCEGSNAYSYTGTTVRTATPGPSGTPSPVAATATPPPAELRYASADPIKAVFDPGSFTTTYTLKLTGRFPEGGSVAWEGPNCGTTVGGTFHLGGGYRSDENNVFNAVFKWTHPHPDCAGGVTDHADVTVVATLSEGSGTPGGTPLLRTVCTYRGSERGTGPDCTITR